MSDKKLSYSYQDKWFRSAVFVANKIKQSQTPSYRIIFINGTWFSGKMKDSVFEDFLIINATAEKKSKITFLKSQLENSHIDCESQSSLNINKCQIVNSTINIMSGEISECNINDAYIEQHKDEFYHSTVDKNKFINSTIYNTEIVNSTLHSLEIEKCNIKDCVLVNCIVYDSSIRKSTVFTSHIRFLENLDGCNLIESEVEDTKTTNSTLYRSKVNGGRLERVKSKKSHIEVVESLGCTFEDSVMSSFEALGCVFTNSTIDSANLNVCKVINCDTYEINWNRGMWISGTWRSGTWRGSQFSSGWKSGFISVVLLNKNNITELNSDTSINARYFNHTLIKSSCSPKRLVELVKKSKIESIKIGAGNAITVIYDNPSYAKQDISKLSKLAQKCSS